MAYIKVPTVFDKLKNAEATFSPVILMAATGWGKTAAVEYYYRRKKPLILYCKDGQLTRMPAPDSFRESIVIIEDMHLLHDEDSVAYLKQLLHTHGLQVVMLTRGSTVPHYLAAEDMDLGFIRISEKDMALGENEVDAFFKEHGIELHPDDVTPITQASKGYPRALYSYSIHMEGGVRYSEDLREAMRLDMFHLWDGTLYPSWSESFIRFALSMCPFDEFTREMAAYVLADPSVGRIINECLETMYQLQVRSNGYYAFRPEIKRYFLWKQDLVWSDEAIRSNYFRAASYYESQGDIQNALKYYQLAGAVSQVKDLLIHNVCAHPGTGHYVDTKDYYFQMDRAELLASPVLIAGMCMLYSLLLLPEQSEEWYHQLELFYQDTSHSKELRKEARTRLAYLDIALPHRGTKGILRIMRDVFALIRKGDIVLPEFCATGNIPSIMNGGLDFIEWSKNDTQIAKFMGRSLEVIVGKWGKGLVTVALAESGFEKGTMEPYEVLTRTNDCFEVASHGGAIEMCFVAVGIQIRQHLAEGQLPSARRIYQSFLQKVKAENASQLLPNLEAMGRWLNLYSGGGEDIPSYIEQIPDARVFFYITERYRQIMKLRCLIAENRLQEALDLATFLDGYYVSYRRYFHQMENAVLKSIILYRLDNENWKDCLHHGLKYASEYHFVRLISLEGAALLPLLTTLREEGALNDIDETYVEQVCSETFKVAAAYPDYLRYIPKQTVNLTSREAQVLSMLCAGLTTDEICQQMKISYEGLKKHNRNIYKKLDVKNRGEAERKAAQLGLIHRG
ncbi:MAG: LuxR C-terminal-related transcriptional regulator [Lachnospiraceae bacterium]|nr:LuxR C-terminal-related transcriptional regulator [Lachnospiraceae bacterium]